MPSQPKSSIPDCQSCILGQNGYGFIPASGTGANGILVIGEAGGEHEDKEGRPFIEWAPAGAILERTFKRAGVDRSLVAIHNVVNCRPSGANFLEHAPYEIEAINHCKAHMDRTVERFQPKVIFALGNVALRTMAGYAGKKQTISNVRGFFLDGIRYPKIPVIASYHPANIARGKPNLLGLLRADFLRAIQLSKAGGKFERPIKNYTCFPPIDVAWKWLAGLKAWVRDHPEELNIFDIETEESLLGVDESELKALPGGMVEWTKIKDEFADVPEHLIPPEEDIIDHTETTRTRITQIQFSYRPTEAIVFPFEGDYIQIAREALALQNPRGDWNGRIFDRPLLREAQVAVDGLVHDFMDAHHHLQPDLPRGLQHTTSIFLPQAEPWKHLSNADPGRYGADDVMYLRQFGPIILERLQKEGLWYGYDRQVRELGTILTGASDRGIPVDEPRRVALGDEVQAARKVVDVEVQGLVPLHLRNVEPKNGYVNAKLAIKKMRGIGYGLEEGEQWGIRDFGSGETVGCGPGELNGVIASAEDQAGVSQDPSVDVGAGIAAKLASGYRWVRVQPFLPNSSQQILRWIKWQRGEDVEKRVRGYQALPRYAATKIGELLGMAERTTLWKVPKAWREDKETTAKQELERLAKRTGDGFLLKIIEHREYGKIFSTYVKGWAPGPDGLVHTTFKFAPATGQLSSSGPNVQNAPAQKGPEGSRQRRIATAFRMMIMAKPSHRIIAADYKAFHVLTTGFEAKAPTWMRLARRDMHSFVTGMFIGEPWEKWLELPDEELDEILSWVKGQKTARYQQLGTKFIRDRKAKPADLAYGFGARENKIYDLNQESFANVGEVKTLFKNLKALDPNVEKWQNAVRRECHEINKGFLKTRFEYVRWFHDVYHWDSRRGGLVPGEDHEAVVALRPSNDAFGIKKDVELWLGDNELDRKFGLVNDVHDELMFHCPTQHDEECIHRTRERMMEPHPRLVDIDLAPLGLWCEVDISAGPSWGELEELKLPKEPIKRIIAAENAARAQRLEIAV